MPYLTCNVHYSLHAVNKQVTVPGINGSTSYPTQTCLTVQLPDTHAIRQKIYYLKFVVTINVKCYT